MGLALNTFTALAAQSYYKTTNVVLSKDGMSLVSTKQRGGVNMLAGLLNIGTRARYGRELLDALKGALVSEFKAQNNLSEEECTTSVNAVFQKAFGMTFEKARSKALKLNTGMIKKLSDEANKQVDNLSSAGKIKNAFEGMKIENVPEFVIKDSFKHAIQNGQMTDSSSFGTGFNAMAKSAASIRKALNSPAFTPSDSRELTRTLNHWHDIVEGCLKESCTGGKAAETTRNDILKELLEKIDKKLEELKKIS